MYVLSEEEYNRLKLQQQQRLLKTDDISNRVVVVEETPIKEISTAAQVDQPKSSPPALPTLLKKYSCTICAKTYKHKRDLRRHVKIVHLITPPTKAIIPTAVFKIENKKKNIRIEKNKKKGSKKNKGTLEVFNKVKKWMTIRV